MLAPILQVDWLLVSFVDFNQAEPDNQAFDRVGSIVPDDSLETQLVAHLGRCGIAGVRREFDCHGVSPRAACEETDKNQGS
jgi:hypothetical protein